MSISLVSAPVLGFDLVRHPAGSEIAQILLYGLALGPEQVGRIGRDAAGSITEQARRQAWQVIHDEELDRGPGSLAGSSLAPSARTADPGVAGLVETLRRSLIVDLDDLEHLIRKDILSWGDATPEVELAGLLVDPAHLRAAGDAMLDAVAALWVDEIDAGTWQALSAPFVRARQHATPIAVDTGPCRDEVDAVLTALTGCGADSRARMRAVVGMLGSGTQEWAAAVHQASWAVFTTGRIRAAATAQLLAVQAFSAAGFDAADGAEGVWNAISGHVQACVVADVLDVETRTLLARTWDTAGIA